MAAKAVCEKYTLNDLLCMINVMIDGDSIDYTTETFDQMFRLTTRYKQLEKRKIARLRPNGRAHDGLKQQRLNFACSFSDTKT